MYLPWMSGCVCVVQLQEQHKKRCLHCCCHSAARFCLLQGLPEPLPTLHAQLSALSCSYIAHCLSLAHECCACSAGGCQLAVDVGGEVPELPELTS